MMTARVRKVFLAMGLGLALMSAIGVASAKVLRWDLLNVTFQDEGTATGFFLFDADVANQNHPLISYDITLGGGNVDWPFPPYRFTGAMSGFEPSNPGIQHFLFYSNPIGGNFLALSLESPALSDAGGKVQLRGPPNGASYVQFTYFGESRSLTSGYLV